MLAVTAASEDLALALELTDVADQITLARFGIGDLAVETKPDMTPVSEADTAVEQALRGRLAQVRPGDAVVGEEYGDAPGSEPGGASGSPAARRWIIDPIDGTKNYVRGIPVWATLLALELDGEIAVGVVSAPALQRRWWASGGQGAFASDERGGDARAMAVSGITELGDAQLSFSGLEEWDESASSATTPSGLLASTGCGDDSRRPPLTVEGDRSRTSSSRPAPRSVV